MESDDTERNKTDTSSGTPPSTDQYLASLTAYREQIQQLSKMLFVTSQSELLSDNKTLRNIDLQLTDVIYNLEKLSGNPLGKKFNKTAFLKHLNNASLEINTVLYLAGSKSQMTSTKCFEHIVKCCEHLNMAKSLIPSPASS